MHRENRRSFTAFGLPELDAKGEPFIELLEDAVDEAIDGIPRSRRRDRDLVGKATVKAMRSLVSQKWGKKPLCRADVTVL